MIVCLMRRRVASATGGVEFKVVEGFKLFQSFEGLSGTTYCGAFMLGTMLNTLHIAKSISWLAMSGKLNSLKVSF